MLSISWKTDTKNVYLSIGIILMLSKMRTIFKLTRTRDKQFLCENMIVLYFVSDWSHVSRADNSVSYNSL